MVKTNERVHTTWKGPANDEKVSAPASSCGICRMATSSGEGVRPATPAQAAQPTRCTLLYMSIGSCSMTSRTLWHNRPDVKSEQQSCFKRVVIVTLAPPGRRRRAQSRAAARPQCAAARCSARPTSCPSAPALNKWFNFRINGHKGESAL